MRVDVVFFFFSSCCQDQMLSNQHKCKHVYTHMRRCMWMYAEAHGYVSSTEAYARRGTPACTSRGRCSSRGRDGQSSQVRRMNCRRRSSLCRAGCSGHRCLPIRRSWLSDDELRSCQTVRRHSTCFRCRPCFTSTVSKSVFLALPRTRDECILDRIIKQGEPQN